MTDVVSFDVRVLLAGDSDFRDLYDPIVQQFAPPNAANSPGFSFQGNGPRVFDTWSSKTDLDYRRQLLELDTGRGKPRLCQRPPPPSPCIGDPARQPISIQAIQITLRVWDFKTKKTRQVTMVQQM